MKYCVLVCLVLVLAGCASTPRQFDYEPGRTIGYLSYSYPAEMCYSHTGMTIFANKEAKSQLDVNLNTLVSKSLRRHAERNGHAYIEIKVKDLAQRPEELWVYTFGGGTAVIQPSQADRLRTYLAARDVGVLILPTYYYNEPDKNGDICNVRYATSLAPEGVLRARRTLRAMDARTLKGSLGMSSGAGGQRTSARADRQGEPLSNEELESLAPLIEIEVDNSVKALFKNVGLGESDFQDKSIFLFKNYLQEK